RRRTSRWDTAGRTAGAVGLSEVLSTVTSTASCRTHSAHSLACRAAWLYAPGFLNLRWLRLHDRNWLRIRDRYHYPIVRIPRRASEPFRPPLRTILPGDRP